MECFEQYGYVLFFAVILVFDKIKNRKVFVSITAVFMFLLLLISETNAFVICPVLLSVCLIRIVTDAWKEQRSPRNEIIFFFLVNLPNAAYCLFSGKYGISEQQVDKQISKIWLHNENFTRLEEIGYYLTGGERTNTDYTKSVHLSANTWQMLKPGIEYRMLMQQLKE